ncbi:NAD(P)H-dependent oxidoreductase [Clostridium sp. CF011]|uniref:NAD(P)H-dependent oxidoreductase n=1 Tax=Clostridium sp. CF011 TaxID=2843318 RepID=UPI001C0C8C56|nr:NAD(P)H-dependent oxidoreductase [Clostridium sp. CF011]MBU3093590.1 NAD(P)H-dependent oxidoreductase [Clostridium sp. CF011]WAG71687.1 NAD(P)H-dependent oxidoreductase [Clostridium sp. CF011]
MKNICFINGSPKGKKSSSFFFINKLDEEVNEKNYNKFYIHATSSIHSGKIEEDFKTMDTADVIVIAFPLYIYCVPGLLMRFLEDYYMHFKTRNALIKDVRVYAVVNCAFPDPMINNETIRVLKNFCVRLNLNWRFAVSIGAGGLVGAAKKIKFINSLCSKVYDSLYEINKDIETNLEKPIENKYAAPNSSILLYGKIGKSSWIKAAMSNGLSEEDLYKKPYIN